MPWRIHPIGHIGPALYLRGEARPGQQQRAAHQGFEGPVVAAHDANVPLPLLAEVHPRGLLPDRSPLAGIQQHHGRGLVAAGLPPRSGQRQIAEQPVKAANAKRTAEDKRFRREFHRAGARAGRGWGRATEERMGEKRGRTGGVEGTLALAQAKTLSGNGGLGFYRIHGAMAKLMQRVSKRRDLTCRGPRT